MEILITTTNEGKYKQIKKILECFNTKSLLDINYSLEVEESEDTFEKNALKKAEEFAKGTGMISIADDSGLCIDELDGWPGVITARFLGKGATQIERNEYILNKVSKLENRSAKVITAIAVAFPNGKSYCIQESLSGNISENKRGSNGFGFDEIFEYQGKTLAEMNETEKDGISMRKKALEKIKKILNENMG